TEIQTGTSLGDLKSVAMTMDCKDPKLTGRVGNFVLVPGNGDSVYVQIKGNVATSANGTQELSASRIIRYVSHTKLELPIDLSAACIGITCAEDESCSMGQCIKKMQMGCRENCDAGMDVPSVPPRDASSEILVSKDVVIDDAPDDVLPIVDAVADAPLVDAG